MAEYSGVQPHFQISIIILHSKKNTAVFCDASSDKKNWQEMSWKMISL